MKRNKLIYISLSAVLLIVAVAAGVYSVFFGESLRLQKHRVTLYIPTGSSFLQVMDTLDKKVVIKNRDLFIWFAGKKHYPESVKPGRYVLDRNYSYNSLINLLRSGKQSPVKLTFNNVRTLEDIAGRIGKQIEADSSRIISFFSDTSNYHADGFRKENLISVFIPNTYEVYWNTDVKALYSRMLKEYRSFWNEQRLSEAKAKGLTQQEVVILASIIDDESAKSDEKPRIAGVYLNRLRRGMPLQSCPTIKFALNDFTITRVLKKYLTIDSPYNTYMHTGFPPGPIGCASIEGIDAVLNAENHDFLFFAAKADFSGYHNFSRTLSEHNRYAAQYQEELDKRRIFK